MIAIDQQGSEPILVLVVWWGSTTPFGTPAYYADRSGIFGGMICTGKILQVNNISKTGQLEQSGVSISTSFTLDDSDGGLKYTFDNLILEGSFCEVYQCILQTSPITQIIMSGYITSDIKWSESNRTLSFGIQSGSTRNSQSGYVGYAPQLGAFAALNPAVVGKNWPLVFGTGIKVPAVKIEGIEGLSTESLVSAATTSFNISNGEQLPQGTPITLYIDQVIFVGTMTNDVFTPTSKNMPQYAGKVFAARPTSGDPDITNPLVAWVPTGVNLQGLYVNLQGSPSGSQTNQCISQVGQKCYFAQSWFNNILIGNPVDVSKSIFYTINAAARFVISTWTTTFTVFGPDGTTFIKADDTTWYIPEGTAVYYYDATASYAERYVANLVPSATVSAVWARRRLDGILIWAKVPSAYYVITLNQPIVTIDNGVTTTRNCTVLDFQYHLKSYYCEGWEEGIYVTQISTLPSSPEGIIQWVTATFTTFSYDPSSDSPAIPMNFAYFKTTDALEFIKEIAYQSASTIQIGGANNYLRLNALYAQGGSGEVLNFNRAIGKSFEQSIKTKEETNTLLRSVYYTDYTGQVASKCYYEVMQTPMVLGPKTVEKELWALTDKLPVKAITDFWNTKVSKSWKHVKLECFLDALDLVIFQGVVVDFSPFSLSSVHGIVTALNYDPNTFKVVVEIELAVEDGMTVEDSSYWTFGTTTYTVPTDTDLDYHPQLSVFCPGGHNKGNPKPLYHMCLTKVPPRILRTQPFDLDIEIHDATDTLQPLSATFNGKVYTTSPHDSLVVKGFSTVGGKATLTVILKGSLLLGRLHLYVMPVSNKEIASGDVIMYKPKTLNGKHM